jgi:pyridoxine kinase
MQAILAKTAEKCKAEMETYDRQAEKLGLGSGDEDKEYREKRRHLALMNASEVQVVRYVRDLLEPGDLERFRARKMEDVSVPGHVGEKVPGEFGVLRLGLGGAPGAVQVVTGDAGEVKEEGEKEEGGEKKEEGHRETNSAVASKASEA